VGREVQHRVVQGRAAVAACFSVHVLAVAALAGPCLAAASRSDVAPVVHVGPYSKGLEALALLHLLWLGQSQVPDAVRHLARLWAVVCRGRAGHPSAARPVFAAATCPPPARKLDRIVSSRANRPRKLVRIAHKPRLTIFVAFHAEELLKKTLEEAAAREELLEKPNHDQAAPAVWPKRLSGLAGASSAVVRQAFCY